MKNDLRTKILASKPTMVEPVDVPAWGVTVYVKELTLAERDKFEAGQVRRNADGTAFLDTVGLKARLVALTACDENGDLIFDESDVDSIMGLGAAGQGAGSRGAPPCRASDRRGPGPDHARGNPAGPGRGLVLGVCFSLYPWITAFCPPR